MTSFAQWALDVGAGMKGEVGYPTPEDAALAEWEDDPEVPSHPIWNYCLRTPNGWVLTHDHN